MELREYKPNTPFEFEDLEIGETRSSNYKNFFEGSVHRKSADLVEIEIKSLDTNKIILIYQKNLTNNRFSILKIEDEDWVITIDGKNVDKLGNYNFSKIWVKFANNHPIALLKLKA